MRFCPYALEFRVIIFLFFFLLRRDHLPAVCKRNTISLRPWATQVSSRRDNYRFRRQPPRNWWRTVIHDCCCHSARRRRPRCPSSVPFSARFWWSRTYCRWCWSPSRRALTRWGWPRKRHSCSSCWNKDNTAIIRSSRTKNWQDTHLKPLKYALNTYFVFHFLFYISKVLSV